MAKRKSLHIVMHGSGMHEDFLALSHVMHPNPGGTYHEFLLTDGATRAFFNDFGIQKILITPVDHE